MAKIRYFKLKGKKLKGNEINSIVGENYLNDYQNRIQKQRELDQENNDVLIESEKIILLQQSEDNE